MKIKKTKMDALRYALGVKGNESGWLHIFTVSGDRYEDRKTGKPLVWGVNWAACGTCTVEETFKFMESLKQATEICNCINALELQDTTLPDDKEYTLDEYKDFCKQACLLLDFADTDVLRTWLNK